MWPQPNEFKIFQSVSIFTCTSVRLCVQVQLQMDKIYICTHMYEIDYNALQFSLTLSCSTHTMTGWAMIFMPGMEFVVKCFRCICWIVLFGFIHLYFICQHIFRLFGLQSITLNSRSSELLSSITTRLTVAIFCSYSLPHFWTWQKHSKQYE